MYLSGINRLVNYLKKVCERTEAVIQVAELKCPDI